MAGGFFFLLFVQLVSLSPHVQFTLYFTLNWYKQYKPVYYMAPVSIFVSVCNSGFNLFGSSIVTVEETFNYSIYELEPAFGESRSDSLMH